MFFHEGSARGQWEQFCLVLKCSYMTTFYCHHHYRILDHKIFDPCWGELCFFLLLRDGPG